MLNAVNTDLHRIATAAIGALILSTVAPARAVETGPVQVAAHQAQLSDEVRA